jgi:hypothetical protein
MLFTLNFESESKPAIQKESQIVVSSEGKLVVEKNDQSDNEKRDNPHIFVSADSLKEAYDKYYSSEYATKYKTCTGINIFSPDGGIVFDIHKKPNPMLYTYRYFDPRLCTEVSRCCLADSVKQVIDSLPDDIIMDIDNMYEREDTIFIL